MSPSSYFKACGSHRKRAYGSETPNTSLEFFLVHLRCNIRFPHSRTLLKMDVISKTTAGSRPHHFNTCQCWRSMVRSVEARLVQHSFVCRVHQSIVCDTNSVLKIIGRGMASPSPLS